MGSANDCLNVKLAASLRFLRGNTLCTTNTRGSVDSAINCFGHFIPEGCSAAIPSSLGRQKILFRSSSLGSSIWFFFDRYVSNQSDDLPEVLPLVFRHTDINGLNILTNGDGEILGVKIGRSLHGSFWIQFLRTADIFAERQDDKMMVVELEKPLEETYGTPCRPRLFRNTRNHRGRITVAHAIDNFIEYSTISRMLTQFSEYHIESLGPLFKDIDSPDMLSRKSSSTLAAIQ